MKSDGWVELVGGVWLLAGVDGGGLLWGRRLCVERFGYMGGGCWAVRVGGGEWGVGWG